MGAAHMRGLAILLTLLGLAQGAAGTVIVDADVEDDGDWTADLFPADPWDGTGFGFLAPGFQEGSEAAVFQDGDSISQGFSAFTLQEGIYTVEFALGDYSNAPFPATAIAFTGMALGAASASSTPTPASGGWALWTVTWTVAAGNPNLGSPLSFSLSTTPGPPAANLAFDGVGALSASGDGFIISYVPEPATASLLAGGLLLLAVAGGCARG